jgi:hypothetical protein
MAIAALLTWLITAGVGFFMLIHESECSRILGWPPRG